LHGFADAEQTKFAVFNIVGIRYFSVNGIPMSKLRYRYWLLNIGYRGIGLSIRKQHVMPYSALW